MPSAENPRPPTYNETVEIVADALVEMREDNRTCHPNDKSNEETFVIGAVRLYMSETYAPVGSAMGYMSATIKTRATQMETSPRYRSDR